MALTGKHGRCSRHDNYTTVGATNCDLQALSGSWGNCDENILKRDYGAIPRVKGHTANMAKPVGGMIAFWTKTALDTPVVSGVGSRRFPTAENMAQIKMNFCKNI